MRKLWLLLAVASVASTGCGDSGTTGTGGGDTGGGNTGGSTTSMMTTTTTTSNSGGGGEGGSTTSNMDVCGDGQISGFEACDDANTASGDGCDPNCAIETGYVCAGEPSACATDCGDGILAGLEECDDQNDVAGDGCDMMCAIEPGFACAGEPSACASTCGDGTVASDEGCDDGGLVAGDGCDDGCVIEPGWTCSGEPTTCMETGCGDGLMVGMEACDDGNMTDGDGCSMGCQIETGFDCTGTAPTVCAPVCGDGTAVAGEQCDDGNTDGGDCCSSTCQVEAGCEIEANNTLATANDFSAVSITSVVHGFIDPSGDTDYFAVTIPAGGNGVISAETSDGILGTVCAKTGVAGIDSRIRIFNSSSMTALVTNDDTVTDYCSLATTGALPPGTYYVVVDASTGAGANNIFDYDLTITVTPIVCGDGAIGVGETCDDGNAMAGDGCSATCATELGYQCNGTPSVCTPLPGVDCSNPIVASDSFTYTGSNLAAYGDDYNFTDASCGDVVGTPNASPEMVFSIALTAGQRLNVKNFGTLDVVWQVVSPTCGVGACLANFDGFPGVGSSEQTTGLNYTAATTGTYYVVVESYSATPSASSTFDIRFQVATCGDGVVELGEPCDDGNANPNDGCSVACTVEPGYTCTGSPSSCSNIPNASCADPIVATNGFAYVGSNMNAFGDDLTFTDTVTCQGTGTGTNHPDLVFQIALQANEKVTVKNFGSLDLTFDLTTPCAAGAQACLKKFDGSPGVGSDEQTTGLQFTASTAGTYYVVVESYYDNPSATGTFDIRFAVTACGNGTVEAGETCDDGNTMAGDGCNATCAIESPFMCSGSPSVCTNIMSLGDTCAAPLLVTAFPTAYSNANFNQFTNDIVPQTPSCAATSSGAGRDVIFQVTVPAGKTLTATGSGGLDTVRNLLPACNNTTACTSAVDDPDDGPVTFTNNTAAPVDVFVVDENFSTTVPTGAFGLTFKIN